MPDDMGTFRTDVEIANPTQPLKRELIGAALVDTGAALSWFPASVLQSLGITKLKELHFRKADGTILSRWSGAAVVYAGGTVTHDEVVFGEQGDLVLLGARSLEGLNLRVDPVSMQLVDAGPASAAAGSIVAGSARRRKWKLRQLVDGITLANRHREIRWGGRTGTESN